MSYRSAIGTPAVAVLASLALLRAIADVLCLDRNQRRILDDAARHFAGPASRTRLDDFDALMKTILYCSESWDREGGFPGVLAGDRIPLDSRVLAVAEAWSALTASGTRQLRPQQAIEELKSCSGSEFDPHLVAVAVRAIEEETLSARRGRSGFPAVAQ